MRYLLGISAVLLMGYGLVAGLLSDVPRLPILNESIRMLYVHVPMWFGMVVLFTASAYYALRYLRSRQARFDAASLACAQVGFCYGLLGMATGMLWANYTWGSPWSQDPKQNAAAVSLLLYLAYFILRVAVADRTASARMAAVYNVLGYGVMLPLIFVLPRLTDSLHPGSGGNPGFNTYDLNQGMRLVFYPTVLGWILFGFWLARLQITLASMERLLSQGTQPPTTPST